LPAAENQSALLTVGVDDDVGRGRSELTAGVEYPGRTDAVDPGTAGAEGRLMHMPGKDQVGSVHGDPLFQFDVTEVALPVPADRCGFRRRVVDPDPAPGAH
jgi:hypothetical protein